MRSRIRDIDNHKPIFIALMMMGIILLSSIGTATAVTDWSVQEGETVRYSVTQLDSDVVLLQGEFTITINQIDTNAETMEYSISADFTTDTNSVASNLTSPSTGVMNGSTFTIDAWNLIVLYDRPAFEDYKGFIDTHVAALQEDYFDDYGDYTEYRYGIKQLSYGWEIKFLTVGTGVNTYEKIQYNAQGMLTSYEMSSLSADDKETGLKIALVEYSGATGGIPGYSTPAILVSTVFVLVVSIRRVKKNN